MLNMMITRGKYPLLSQVNSKVESTATVSEDIFQLSQQLTRSILSIILEVQRFNKSPEFQKMTNLPSKVQEEASKTALPAVTVLEADTKPTSKHLPPKEL